MTPCICNLMRLGGQLHRMKMFSSYSMIFMFFQNPVCMLLVSISLCILPQVWTLIV